MPKKEYRVNAKGSYQGHYILADSKTGALNIARENPSLRGEPLEVHLWKTAKKKDMFPSHLTKYAMRKMRRVS